MFCLIHEKEFQNKYREKNISEVILPYWLEDWGSIKNTGTKALAEN
jgi:hypothetical protein